MHSNLTCRAKFSGRCASQGAVVPGRPLSLAGVSVRSWRARAWQPVLDPSTGKQYYWNTDTNETAWDLPDGQQLAPSTGMDPGSGAAPSTVASSAQVPVQHAELPLPPEQLYDALAAAYAADGSGMQFWEVARAHRSQGVFDDAFFDWLTRESRSGERAELAAKMMARLSNPLLRQPAPFEF